MWIHSYTQSMTVASRDQLFSPTIFPFPLLVKHSHIIIFIWVKACSIKFARIRNSSSAIVVFIATDIFKNTSKPASVVPGAFVELEIACMQARPALVEGLYPLETRILVESQLDHLMDILRLYRSDNIRSGTLFEA